VPVGGFASELMGLCGYDWVCVDMQHGLLGYEQASAMVKTLCITMTETVEGDQNMDKIMQVEGVDAIYVSPSDLAVTHGYLPALEPVGSPPEKLIFDVLERCKRNNVIPGIHAAGVETAQRWAEAGVKMIALSTDAEVMRRASMSTLRGVRGDVPVQAGPSTSVYA
jgi:4-hydroxy-2-oxoheptanedioate aldolase